MIDKNTQLSLAMEKRTFDIAVLGSGPGGYVAAIKAAQLGASVCLIEAEDLGGTCLNRGCIPTKALVANASVLAKIKEAKNFGIEVGSISFDWNTWTKNKDELVSSTRRNLTALIKSNQITLIQGFGTFLSPTEIRVVGKDSCRVVANKIIIATGSEPNNIASFPFDGEKIHSSTSLLNLKKLPKHLVIVGAGYIGCEFASIYAEVGVKVTLLEAMDKILPFEAVELSDFLNKRFEKQGIDIQTNVRVCRIDTQGKGIKVELEGGKTINADMALVAIGRKLNSDNIGLDKAGVATDHRGAIEVDDRMQTNMSGIYAIGDVTSKWLLAHVASHQGLVAASNACGQPCQIHYNAVPSVVFTQPEIATVGYNLKQAQELGFDAKVGAFPFQAIGKAQAVQETDGFAQIVVEKHTGRILGAQAVGHEVGSLIAEMGLAIQNELTLESIQDTIHAHPTLSEVWLEAAMMADETPIHLPPKRRKTTSAT